MYLICKLLLMTIAGLLASSLTWCWLFLDDVGTGAVESSSPVWCLLPRVRSRWKCGYRSRRPYHVNHDHVPSQIVMAQFLVQEFKKYMSNEALYECLICSEILTNNRECKNCATLFCYKCIKEWIEKTRKCPHCLNQNLSIRDEDDFTHFSFNRPVQRLINELEVDCPLGCEQRKVKRGNLQDHLNGLCSKARKPCTMKRFGCNFEGNVTELAAHACAYLQVRPLLERMETELNELKQVSSANNQAGEKSNQLRSELSTLKQANELLKLELDECKTKIRKLTSTAQNNNINQSFSSSNSSFTSSPFTGSSSSGYNTNNNNNGSSYSSAPEDHRQGRSYSSFTSSNTPPPPHGGHHRGNHHHHGHRGGHHGGGHQHDNGTHEKKKQECKQQ